MQKTTYIPLSNGFYPKLGRYIINKPWENCQTVTPTDIKTALSARNLSPEDFISLISPAAENFLEDIAQKAHDITLRQFGRSIQLFTPLYLANHCTNRCVYCGFNTGMHIERNMLSLEEVEKEAKAIHATGLRSILALTGDAPRKTGPGYLAECIKVLARYFSTVGIEVPSMTVEEYALVVKAGVNSMTLFQETYNESLYADLHPSGPKRDFMFRLDAPERAILGGVRSVNLGALLGLDDWHRDIFLTALHAYFLTEKYPQAEVHISLPRIRPCGPDESEASDLGYTLWEISDRHFVQILVALRCFLPQVGITLSTREPASLRDRLIHLGVTRMSAGVSTAVGGHTATDETERAAQFDISDTRTVTEMANAIQKSGYQPIYADWLLAGDGNMDLPDGIKEALGQGAQYGNSTKELYGTNP